MATDPEAQTAAAAEEPRPLLRPDEVRLRRSLRRLEAFLAALGFYRSSSPPSVLLSCSIFLLLGVAVPVASIRLSRCPLPGCEPYQIERHEVWSFLFAASFAALSLACISRNLFKYGTRRFLFVDQHQGLVERLQLEYAAKIKDFFCLLFWWILPCFLVKTAREVVRFVYVPHDSMWISFTILIASVLSWAYLNTIFLCACLFFNLVCNLQLVHFDDFGKLLERDTDPLVYLEEHMRLRYYLSKISHRFRVYLLSLFLVITASQFVTLFQTTGYSEIVNFTNAGDLAVSSVVQVVGVVLCLHAAAKISHRAQGIASVASKWHALVTCTSGSSHLRAGNSSSNLEAISGNFLAVDYSESDLESIDITVQNNAQIVSYMSSYHKRQALVMYFQSNPGGITIFGWTIDRTMISTMFFFELTIALFVLGKTLVFTK